VVLVCSVFWVARRHLREVFRKALGRSSEVDDQGELLSYRAALIGLVLGLLYMWTWLTRAGFDAVQAAFLLLAVVFTYVGMAKIIADTGLPYTNVPAGPWGLVAPWIGSQGISASTQVAYRFSGILTSHFKGLFLPALTHAGKVAEGVSDRRRQLLVAVSLAFGVSLLVSFVYTLHLGYQEGAYNFNSWEITRAGERHFAWTAKAVKKILLRDVKPPDYVEHPEYISFFALGGALMASLIYMRYRFARWPLHPVGLAISGSYLARLISFTVFLAWVLKLVMLKVGGPSVYRKSRPFFVGLLVGYILGVALSAIIDMIWFPDRGHYVHRYAMARDAAAMVAGLV